MKEKKQTNKQANFIRDAQNRKIGKPNNLKCWEQKTKRPKQDIQNHIWSPLSHMVTFITYANGVDFDKKYHFKNNLLYTNRPIGNKSSLDDHFQTLSVSRLWELNTTWLLTKVMRYDWMNIKH
jgi:hypothetical protein